MEQSGWRIFFSPSSLEPPGSREYLLRCDAIDGTGQLPFQTRHCPPCLTCTLKDGTILYYHPVLEAKLVTANGFAFSVMTEFMENPSPGVSTQDGELKAFYRLADRLKQRFPRLPLCLLLDGLYAGGPTFALCERYGWPYLITLKDRDLPTVNEEFEALSKLEPGQALQFVSGKLPTDTFVQSIRQGWGCRFFLDKYKFSYYESFKIQDLVNQRLFQARFQQIVLLYVIHTISCNKGQMVKYRLAILTLHPIQYQVPLFRRLATHPQVDLMVYFCSDHGVIEELDPEFGVAFRLDIPLLNGYRSRFLKTYGVWPSPGRFGGLLNPGILPELWKGRYDAVLIFGYGLPVYWFGVLGARLSRTPILLSGETLLREDQPIWWRTLKGMLLGFLFRQVEAFLPIGTRSAEFYRHYGIPEGRLFLMPYSVDNDFFLDQASIWKAKVAETKKELGLKEDMPVILYLSKLIRRKRPLDLLMAFERLDREAALVFVGEGELRSPMEEQVRRRGMKNVRFVGFKNQTEVPRYYAIGDVFVLPSGYEPWGIVVNEAMCFGLPVIATDAVAAAVDLVHHGENGYVYRAGDINGLTRALEALLGDPDLRQSFGRRSLGVISRWSYEADVEGVLMALEFAYGKGRGSS